VLAFKKWDWQAYCEFNQQVAVQIAPQEADRDLVWTHDHHLTLLPAKLFREASRRNKRFVIGFFLQTPFPSGDIFKVVSVWRDLLEGVLHSILIGFHTTSYAENFRRTCLDLL
jgi:trehalose-6-phosphate synthase